MGSDVVVVTDFRPLPAQPNLPPPAAVPGHEENSSNEVETGVDVTVALEEALEAARPKHQIPGHTVNRYDVATIILFPALPPEFAYLLTRTVRIPEDMGISNRCSIIRSGGTWHDPDLGRPLAAPLDRCAELLGVQLATTRKVVTNVEPYIRADGTKVWSLMQLEHQLRPEAYGRRRGGYLPAVVKGSADDMSSRGGQRRKYELLARED